MYVPISKPSKKVCFKNNNGYREYDFLNNMISKLGLTTLTASWILALSPAAIAEDNFYRAGRFFVEGDITIHNGDQDTTDGHDNSHNTEGYDIGVSYSVFDNLTLVLSYFVDNTDTSSVGSYHNTNTEENHSGYGIGADYYFQIGDKSKFRPFVGVGYQNLSHEITTTETYSGFPNAAAMNNTSSNDFDLTGLQYRVGVTYTLTDNIGLRADYSIEKFDSDGYDHDGKTFSVGFVIGS